MGYRICVNNCSYSFMENLCLKGALGMDTVLQQVLHGGIIRVLQTQFSRYLLFTEQKVEINITTAETVFNP